MAAARFRFHRMSPLFTRLSPAEATLLIELRSTIAPWEASPGSVTAWVSVRTTHRDRRVPSQSVRSFATAYRLRPERQSPKLRFTGAGDAHRVSVAGYLGSESVVIGAI